MDHDYRKNKPQQRLYKPGSGPLRKSINDVDSKMISSSTFDITKRSSHSHYGSKSSVYEEDSMSCDSNSTRNKKPDQKHYIARSMDKFQMTVDGSVKNEKDNQGWNRRRNDRNGYNNNSGYRGTGRKEYKDSGQNDDNYNRGYRQFSEPRSLSPSRVVRDINISERNRDSRSMEVSAGRHNSNSIGKPPSGRRNSAGYPDPPKPKHQNNAEIPPRFRKNHMKKFHPSLESVDSPQRDNSYHSIQPVSEYQRGQNNVGSWSQTLPSRGRGRLRENEHFDREKFISNYLRNQDLLNSRQSTPSSSYANIYEQTENKDNNDSYSFHSLKQNIDEISKNGISNKKGYENQEEENSIQESDSEAFSLGSMNLGDMANLDWTEEVEKDEHHSSESSVSYNVQSAPISQDIRPQKSNQCETNESKQSSKRRSSSRGKRNEKKDRRRESGSSNQGGSGNFGNARMERERRDSHRSNRSSTIGGSRDDLSKWRSTRSFSRDHSTDRKVISQCNSRDTSANRVLSSRDSDGFKMPSAPSTNNNQRRNDRGRHSPTPSNSEDKPRSSRRSSRKKKNRNTENTAPPPQSQSTNWREEIIESKKHSLQDRLDRHKERPRNRLSSCHSDKSEGSSHPGIIILPQGTLTNQNKEISRQASADSHKTLFDHHNPSTPIVVPTSSSKGDARLNPDVIESWAVACASPSEASVCRHASLLRDVDRADAVLQAYRLRPHCSMLDSWPLMQDNRVLLQNALQKLLLSDLKYCQANNTEHKFWKMLYYNFIEVLRESLPQSKPEDKLKIVKLINMIIEEGTTYFENLILLLQKTYNFNIDTFLKENYALPPKGLGYVGLALIYVQKLFLFLGDLARYKEQVNETNNYAKSKYWYTRAQQVNPKNGRPYNQLAILAIYAKRKLDAVYYYMRSLMSSNAFNSARESLISIFDENRKKYEAAEKKRHLATESNIEVEEVKGPRREVWVRPGGGGRTTIRAHDKYDGLANMTPVELSKTFMTTYLYVHGKLVTRIGMESFHDSAVMMLRQFRALLHLQPLPIPPARLLQLTALNMFAVESATGSQKENKEERGAWLECALSVSLLMFGALLERCCALLPHPENTQHHADALLLLPAIKVWSDWMLCHSSKWNPPPSIEAYNIGSENDPWDWLAKLMNILESLDDKNIVLENEMKEGCESVRLSEDSALAGFTPLMYMEPASAFARHTPPAKAEHALRTRKLLFFGTEYLVGVEPPVLRLEYPVDAQPRYISAVEKHLAHSLQQLSEDSDEETDEPNSELATLDKVSTDHVDDSTDETTKRLLKKKEILEAKRANIERRKQKMQELLDRSAVEIEVRPRWLVPDTNCFIEHLPLLQRCGHADSPCLLAVPLVVVNELEGLRKCNRIGGQACQALEFLSGGSGVRFATTRGSVMSSRAFAEQDVAGGTNDDRVLATALNMHVNIVASQEDAVSEVESTVAKTKSTRRIHEVVLLTDDRNLRVKAMAAELPVRDLPSFVEWAGFNDSMQSSTAPVTAETSAAPRA